MARTVDLNADLAEDAGDDAAMLSVVTSANLCCGAHAGGPATLRAAIVAAKAAGVTIGAHPGYADRANFGRLAVPMATAELTRMVTDQLSLTLQVAADAGARVAYVKPHGALYNLAAVDAEVATAISVAITEVDRTLALLGLAGSVMLKIAQTAGLQTAAEAFADRAYQPDGQLVPRSQSGAVLTDANVVAARAVAMVRDGTVMAADGSQIDLCFDSLCLHGDTPDAVAMARQIKAGLQAEGIAVQAFAS